MSEEFNSEYFASRATKARAMAERATTPAARDIHLTLAAEYDARAAAAAAPAEAPGEEDFTSFRTAK